MTKDGNDGRKGGQENLSNGRSHKRNKRRLPPKASKVILKLGPPPASEQTTSLKLEDALGNEVKERLDDWRDADDTRILLNILFNSISICNKYSVYDGDGEWKASVQAVSHTLTWKCKKEHDKFMTVKFW